MSTRDWSSVPAIFDNVRSKEDIFDSDRFPNDGPCDMNYRIHASTGPLVAMVYLAGFGILAFGAAIVLRSFGTTLWSEFALASCCLGGCLIAVFRLWRSPSARAWSVLFWLAALPLTWFVLAALPLTAAPLTAWCFLAAIGLPLSMWLADTIALHSIDWMTACPRVDITTMLRWRADWRTRWIRIAVRVPRRHDLSTQERQLHDRVGSTLRAYRRGVVYVVLLAVLLPLAWYFSHHRQPLPVNSAGTCLIMLVGLAGAALARTASWPGAFGVYLQCVSHWLTHNGGEGGPPWVFRSPAGPLAIRWLKTFAVLILLSSSLPPIADHFWWFLNGSAPRLSPEAMMRHATQEMKGPYMLFCQACQWVAIALFPMLALFLIGYVLVGPVLAAHFAALEASDAYEAHLDWSAFDGYVHRLQFSRNRHERNALFIGFHPVLRCPILLDKGLLFEHVHVVGATGIGKTVLGLMTQCIQLIRGDDDLVVIMDFKGDPALFHTAAIEAKRAGRKFKWLTTEANRATHVFNPIDGDLQRQLTLPELVGFLAQAMNLMHGADYGRAWFTIAARILLRAGFLATSTRPEHLRDRNRTTPEYGQIQSLRDLNRVVMQEMNRSGLQAAQHVAFLIESLCDFDQLNMAANRDPHHPALANAISMSQALRERQVLYFYLVGATDNAGIAEIARLALFRLLAACIQYKHDHGRAPRAYCIIDEAQFIIANNIATVLAQARSHGLSVTLSHQTMSQLAPPGGADLREMVINCTSVKRFFSARDPWTQDYLSKVSGQTKYMDESVTYSARDGWCPTYSYRAGPRLTPQDIADISRDDNMCLTTIERGKGLSRTNGSFPMSVDWPTQEHEYQERLNDMPWPAPSEATITVPAFWPEETPEVVQPAGPLAIAADLDAEERLRQLRELLNPDEGNL